MKLSAEKVRAIRSSRLPGVEVARAFGISESLVSLIRAGRRYAGAGGPVRSSRPVVKLTADEVRRIRRSSGPSRLVAARFGISQGQVCNIRAGRRRVKGRRRKLRGGGDHVCPAGGVASSGSVRGLGRCLGFCDRCGGHRLETSTGLPLCPTCDEYDPRSGALRRRALPLGVLGLGDSRRSST